MSETLGVVDGRSQALADAHAAMEALVKRRSDTEKRVFDMQNIPDTQRRLQAQLDNPESFTQGFWERSMTDFLIHNTAFGSYCHEGQDLVRDFMNHWRLLSEDVPGVLGMIADELVEEYEASQCGFCNDNYDEENEGEIYE